MTYSLGQLNTTWAHALIQTLIHHGVDYFCLAPGSRITPLSLAIAENPKAQTCIHFDERGSAFHALGYAKATKKPAVLLVTSGTALGNLYPAVMEASYSRIPLILLTADRPAELRCVKANQTADQIKIFGDYVRFFFDLPSPNPLLPLEFPANTVAQAFATACYPLPGPVHLNCPFPEPLFDNAIPYPIHCQSTKYCFPKLHPQKEELATITATLEKANSGVIILGTLDRKIHKAVNALAQKLNWPIFPDIISSFREEANYEYAIPYYHHLIMSMPEFSVDAILHIGEQWVSKPLLQWVGKQKGCPLIHISRFQGRCDPMHVVTHKVIADEEITCDLLTSLIFTKQPTILTDCKKLSFEIEQSLEKFFQPKSCLTEPSVVKIMEAFSSKYALFLGNSMPIRDGDMFFFPKKPCNPIFANRGLSGIDGNVATCAGIAMYMPLMAILGDQTLLHDLNSLAQLQKTRYPVKLIIINNEGGGIFSFLPIQNRKDVLDTHFATVHTLRFEKAAELFSLPYFQPQTEEDLQSALHQGGSSLIEVLTNREENYLLHQQINQIALQATKGIHVIS